MNQPRDVEQQLAANKAQSVQAQPMSACWGKAGRNTAGTRRSLESIVPLRLESQTETIPGAQDQPRTRHT